MDTSEYFTVTSKELCDLLSNTENKKGRVNSLIDELNANTYKKKLIAQKQDVVSLVYTLCNNIKPSDEFLVAKSSHLINNMVTKQNISFASECIRKSIAWHVDCLKNCSEIILPDILHSMEGILQYDPVARKQDTNELISILLNIISMDRNYNVKLQNPLQTCLTALKCITCLMTTLDDNKMEELNLAVETKAEISAVLIKFLMKGHTKIQDEFVYCKVVIYALRVLSRLYFNDSKIDFALPEVMGICRYFILYGLVTQKSKPEKIMPSQQTIAAVPLKINPKGGKKQKVRKQRNNAIESLKKEIPVSDCSLMKDVSNFENTSAYKPASQNFLEPQNARNCWTLTSDSDMSDMENSRESKLIALKSRVRQSASNLFLVIFKIKEKKETFGYWWALLPDSPCPNNLFKEEAAKTTLAYCAITDPIVSSRTSALSVILALLAGSKLYLSQAEASKTVTTSFTPFSISLGYMTTCMHKVLTTILDNERNHGVILVALKCCAALVQATPYHKMQEGLITDLVRSTRKFLVHRDVQLQVSALIAIGCVLSVYPHVDEVLKAMEKDSLSSKVSNVAITQCENAETDDFEEGYSDDEMFTAVDSTSPVVRNVLTESWILDICFKNMGSIFVGNIRQKCKESVIPVLLESLQVLSAIAYHHMSHLLHCHVPVLGDILAEMLEHEHQDVVTQAARTISVIGDAMHKLEQTDQAPPLGQCVYMWQKLLPPLSSVLQSQENTPAKAVVCDCIANIGERCFKELPSRQQRFCCALLVGSCSDEEAVVRAAAVRALAMAVMYRTLREVWLQPKRGLLLDSMGRPRPHSTTLLQCGLVAESNVELSHPKDIRRRITIHYNLVKWLIDVQDIFFVSDCGENILRALAEPILLIRTKAAWALGNLSDALVLNMDELDIDSIDDDLLLRLLEVSIQCAKDNDKVKMSATRGLGNFLRLIKSEHLLRSTRLKTLCEAAIEKLLDCASKVSNMKVRWNACYALGSAMKNENLFTCFNGWQGRVFSSLCALALECKNLKVRINAAAALRACPARAHYGQYFASVWGGVMAAMDNAANVDDFTEYKHKDNLIEQLWVTLAHLCCLLKQSDLADIMDPLVFHFDCLKSLLTQLYYKLPPENASCLKILQAARYVTMELTAANDTQAQSLGMLQDIFVWDM